MPLRASIDLGNEYFRVEHISEAKDVKAALAGFSADFHHSDQTRTCVKATLNYNSAD